MDDDYILSKVNFIGKLKNIKIFIYIKILVKLNHDTYKELN